MPRLSSAEASCQLASSTRYSLPVLSVTFADLRFRYRQFLIAVVAAGVVFAMAVLMSGLVTGFRVEIRDTINAAGAERWVMSAQSGGRVTSLVTFSEAAVQRVAETPGVTAANGIVFLASEVIRSGSRNVSVNVMGVGAGPLGQPVAQAGHGLSRPGQIVVSTKSDVHLGSTISIGANRFDVVGTIRDRALGAGIPVVYIRLADAQRVLFGGQHVVTAIVTRGVPAQLPSGLIAYRPDVVVSATLETLSSGIASIKTTRVLMWLVAVLIVAALMYVSALQRVRDFAVLKALGSSSATLFGSLCLQAVVVTFLAAIAGVAFAAAMGGVFEQTVQVPASAYYTLPIIAIGVGLIASLIALRRATGADPAAAFGG